MVEAGFQMIKYAWVHVGTNVFETTVQVQLIRNLENYIIQ